MARILIIEDEISYRETLVFRLIKDGYDAVGAATGEEGLEIFKCGGVDLIVLDLMLPGMSGEQVCRMIRSRSNVPIIMLTAKSAENDMVKGLDLGADDYMTKPYSYRELTARIRALLRRRDAAPTAADEELDDTPLVCGPVDMRVTRHVVYIRGKETFFPLKEFEVLECLLRDKGKVVSRHRLIDRVWGADYVGDTKTLDVHIKRIRAKVEEDPAHPVYITTVRGLGYKIDDPQEDKA